MRRWKKCFTWSKRRSSGKLMASRILALDHGTKRIGVALSDELGWTAQPLETFERRSLAQDIAHIQELVKTHEVGQVLLGLPLRLNGEEGPAVKAVREFISRLADALPVPIVTWDERMTTKAAEELLIAADVSRKKRKGVVDRVAAAILLKSYLESLSSASATAGSRDAEGDIVDEGAYCSDGGHSYEAASDPAGAHPRPRRRSRRHGRVSDDSMG